MATKKRAIGDTGENIAAAFLQAKGYRIITRNYLRKWGEIDIVARHGQKTHFVEVKTISRENNYGVSRKTYTYRPEDNMHPKKLERLNRVVATYIEHERGVDNWQIDVVAVELFIKDKKAELRHIQNVL